MPRNLVLIFLSITMLQACVSKQPDSYLQEEVVTYKDQNSDGMIDSELHHFPGMADSDWALFDTDMDRVYDKKIIYGYVIAEEQVSIPVNRSIDNLNRAIHLQPLAATASVKSF